MGNPKRALRVTPYLFLIGLLAGPAQAQTNIFERTSQRSFRHDENLPVSAQFSISSSGTGTNFIALTVHDILPDKVGVLYQADETSFSPTEWQRLTAAISDQQPDYVQWGAHYFGNQETRDGQVIRDWYPGRAPIVERLEFVVDSYIIQDGLLRVQTTTRVFAFIPEPNTIGIAGCCSMLLLIRRHRHPLR